MYKPGRERLSSEQRSRTYDQCSRRMPRPGTRFASQVLEFGFVWAGRADRLRPVPAAGAARAERRRMRSDRARSGHVVCGDLGSAGPTGRSVGIQRRLGQLFHRPDRPHRPHLPPRVRPFIVLCFRIIRSHSSNIYFIVLKCVCPARYSANLT